MSRRDAVRAMHGDELRDYLSGLKAGERVIETGVSGMQGRTGTVYISKGSSLYAGGPCVMWDRLQTESGWMGTSVTGGTRRVSEVLAAAVDATRDESAVVRAARELDRVDGMVPGTTNKFSMREDAIRALRTEIARLDGCLTAAPAAQPAEVCRWKPSDQGGGFDTNCGRWASGLFRSRVCPCGKRIEVAP